MKHLMVLFVVSIFFLMSFIDSSFAQAIWTKNSNNPVLSPGNPGEWDAGSIQVDAVIFDDTTYHMWYTGSLPNDENVSIGYATSPDGISWTKHLSNPVFTPGLPGQWDDGIVASVSIILHDEMFKMWYLGFDGQSSQIGYATSTDGISWTRHPNNPVLSPGETGSWDEQAVQQPVVLFDSDTLHMWYHGTRDFNIFNIGYATSQDGVVWMKNENNPVLKVGSQGEWDSKQTISPFVIKEDGMFQMWYSGKGQSFQIGYATSTDGASWTRHPNNPVLSPGNPGEWDADLIGSPALVFNDPIYHMWYMGMNNNSYQVGNATSTMLTGISGTADIPDGFSLSQNYPNPFNPSTQIRYSVLQSSNVAIKIFDILGNEIETLVSEEKPVGTYEITWYTENLSSGIYFYQLRAGSFIETKKMILMK